MPEDRSDAPLVGLVAVAAVVCCSLPLLAAGAMAAFGGLVFGSVALVAVGVALFAWGARRRGRCPGPEQQIRGEIRVDGSSGGGGEDADSTKHP